MFINVALVHSAADVVPLLEDVAREVMADVELVHMVDEGIERMVDQAGGLTEPVTRRIVTQVTNAHEAGAEAVMLASPVIGSAIDAVRSVTTVPVVRIDRAMAEAAVQLGSAIGVLAGGQVNLQATLALLRDCSDALDKPVDFETALCPEVEQALRLADLDAYDRAVVHGIEGLADNDMVVLADVMMHRVAHIAGDRVHVPVLTSPKHGFEHLAKKLNYFRR